MKRVVKYITNSGITVLGVGYLLGLYWATDMNITNELNDLKVNQDNMTRAIDDESIARIVNDVIIKEVEVVTEEDAIKAVRSELDALRAEIARMQGQTGVLQRQTSQIQAKSDATPLPTNLATKEEVSAVDTKTNQLATTVAELGSQLKSYIDEKYQQITDAFLSIGVDLENFSIAQNETKIEIIEVEKDLEKFQQSTDIKVDIIEGNIEGTLDRIRNLTTDQVAEGNHNLYFTEDRVVTLINEHSPDVLFSFNSNVPTGYQDCTELYDFENYPFLRIVSKLNASGETQEDRFARHQHVYDVPEGGYGLVHRSITGQQTTADGADELGGGLEPSVNVTPIEIPPEGGEDTRPANISIYLWCKV